MRNNLIKNILHLILNIIFLAGIHIPGSSIAQSREYLLKAGFIEKFTRFIDWPVKSADIENTNTFLIVLIGENKFENALETIFGKIKIKEKSVEIKYINSIFEINSCDILIISGSKSDNLTEILKYTIKKPVLTIGETSGYGKRGVMVNMFVDNNRIRYEINLKSLDRSGFKVSSLLLNSAIVIKKNE